MNKPEIPLLIVGGAALVAAVVLLGLGVVVPAELWTLASIGIAGGAGISVPANAVKTAAVDVAGVVATVLDELEGKTPTQTTTTVAAAPPASSSPPAPVAPAATMTTLGVQQ